MNLRSIVKQGIGAVLILAWISFTSNAQVAGNAQASSATHVAAEMTKGKLNPAESKPGDQVALRLKEDVRSNGDVVLKKGTTINGVVRSVKRAEGKGKASGQAQSMMEVEWLAPTAQGNAAQQLSIALQSVMQVNPIYAHEQEQSSGDDFGPIGGRAASSASGAAGSSARSGGGLLGGAVSATTDVAAGVGGAASSTAASSTRASGQSNAALLSMPSIVAVDHQTTASLENTFGMTSSTQLYKVGRGEMITSGSSKQSVDIFSHLSNDTVITSPSKNFEISSGAQMQLLVGVDKK
jgi:hypothetical protein